MARSWRFWVAASLIAHGAAVGIALVATRDHASAADPLHPHPIAFDTVPPPASAPALAVATRDRTDIVAIDPPELGGILDDQNIRANDSGGGGDGRSRERGRLLANRDEDVELSPLLLNSLRVDQEHRLRTAHDAASPQYRRSTPNPGYDPWISSSDGVLLFRVRNAEAVPARGARVPPSAALAAGGVPREVPDAVASTQTLANTDGGRSRIAAGVVAQDVGSAHRVAGPSAVGHASIQLGHASTTTDAWGRRPADTVDAEALATSLVRNAISASVDDGPTRADGHGGVGGGGAPGSGTEQDRGGRARPYGEGSGWISLASPDSRYLHYFQRVREHLDRLWTDAFPREDQLQLRQGTVVLQFVIASDGSVRAVAVQRHSGVDAFDRNVVVAISGARLPPIPRELQVAELHVTAPFIFRNPIVR